MRASLRVLQLVDSLGIGGAEGLTISLAAGLREQGVDARVGSLLVEDGNPLADQLQAAGVPWLDLRRMSTGLLDPRPGLAVASYLRRERIDLVHTHLRYANITGRVGAVLARRPSVTTVHAQVLDPTRLVEPGAGWRGEVTRQLDYLTARAVGTAIVAVSEVQRQAYLTVARVEPERVVTVLNGVDLDTYRPNPEARARLRAQLELDAETTLFATVAMLRPHKGVRHLLEAAGLLRAARRAARYVVVGDGPERASLEAQATALGLHDAVSFLGARHDVSTVLAAADAYVHPSLHEALPTSVLEAMAVGLPVVATRIGGLSEMVLDGETGLLVPPARVDVLAGAMTVLLDPARRASVGAAGRAWVSKHASRTDWVARIRGLYEQVIARTGQNARAPMSAVE